MSCNFGVPSSLLGLGLFHSLLGSLIDFGNDLLALSLLSDDFSFYDLGHGLFHSLLGFGNGLLALRLLGNDFSFHDLGHGLFQSLLGFGNDLLLEGVGAFKLGRGLALRSSQGDNLGIASKVFQHTHNSVGNILDILCGFLSCEGDHVGSLMSSDNLSMFSSCYLEDFLNLFVFSNFDLLDGGMRGMYGTLDTLVFRELSGLLGLGMLTFAGKEGTNLLSCKLTIILNKVMSSLSQ